MNSTNRALNRLLLAITGLASLLAAAAAVLLLAVPGAASVWSRTAGNAVTTADAAFGRPLWPGTTVSAAAAVSLLAALVFVVLLLAFILRQGHGGTSTVATVGTPDGAVEIDTAIPAALIADRLDSVPGVDGVTVSAYRVRGTPALKITVRCRRGASPRTVADALDDAVSRLHDALGTPLPVYAQLVGGFRARLRAPARVDSSTSAARPS